MREEIIPARHLAERADRREPAHDAVTVPLADLKAIKSRLGGSVNDVVLATRPAACDTC